ncbi:zinc-dependent alcohol dehydrogenase [Streptomyces coffeae]|uniref:2-deoxy-scyllo-inosamine dehydrogenase n=1 Tax=Streptomyces coffeae TaxID=621382 RepID=A0ABS1NHT0_9ACTN|nr:alcohol dehydrogenase catalytic domain-containing protein [Streptomyces coffeae]MBL1099677.1 alcohol dehydrogenase catalytic domain-containing protein [Streptomyces coffeae]
MRTAVITAPGQVEIREIPVPDVGDSEVLVRIAACGICTMEANLYAGRMNVYPAAAGHEISGWVEKVGAKAADLEDMPAVGSLVTLDGLPRCGTCRACRRGQSAICVALQGQVREDGAIAMGAGLGEYIVLPASRVWSVGDTDPAVAAMGEPLACVVHSLRRGGFRAGDRVTVIGAGYMGRLHLAVARHLQARGVCVVERDQQRLAAIADAGADAAVTPEDVGHLAPADVVFVTIASRESIATALASVADGGTIVLFGGGPDGPPAELPGYEVHRRQLTVTGSFSHEPDDWRAAAELLRGGGLAERLRTLVTARYALDEVEKALQQTAGTPVYRVVVTP